MKTSLHQRSGCPIACTLDLIGDKWTLLVIRDLLRGATRYSEFARSPEGIATNILADRLNALLEHGLIEQRELPGRRRKTYSLTPLGESLEPVLEAIADWGVEHLPDAEGRLGSGGPQ